MSKFYRNIKPYVEIEIEASRRAISSGAETLAFTHLERAHVLGQEATVTHTRVHWEMLLWGVRQRSLREVAGQIFRLVGAVTKTAFGLVPQGNTGGVNVSPFQSMTISPDSARLIAAAKK